MFNGSAMARKSILRGGGRVARRPSAWPTRRWSRATLLGQVSTMGRSLVDALPSGPGILPHDLALRRPSGVGRFKLAWGQRGRLLSACRATPLDPGFTPIDLRRNWMDVNDDHST